MNIEKIGNKFKKHGVNVYPTDSGIKIVVYINLKHDTAPVFTTLLLSEDKLVILCVPNARSHGYRQVLTKRCDIMKLLNLYYQHVKTKVKLQDLPIRIQEQVEAYGEAIADYFDGKCKYTLSIRERDGYVLVDGKYIKYGDIELLRHLKLHVNAAKFPIIYQIHSNRLK